MQGLLVAIVLASTWWNVIGNPERGVQLAADDSIIAFGKAGDVKLYHKKGETGALYIDAPGGIFSKILDALIDERIDSKFDEIHGTLQCDSGWTGRFCETDVNECAKNNGGCHSKRLCGNTPGGMKCSVCENGYANDGSKGCKACGGNNYYCSGGVRKTVSPGYVTIGGTATTRTGQKKATVYTFGTAKNSGQVTTCSQKSQSGPTVTCKNPSVQWGSHSGGVPHKHSSNNYANYCQSLGFGSFVTGSDKYGTRSCDKGALFWCQGYDFKQGWHWCDWQDGHWKNNGLHYKCIAGTGLTSITCSSTADGKISTGYAVMGTAKDSGQITKCGTKTQSSKLTTSKTVTCQNPTVTWGSHTGIPHKHIHNNYANYCKSLGYSGFVTGSDKYGTRSCSKGALFWCKGYDNPSTYHWCDWQDGHWKNNGLHKQCIANTALTSFTCQE